MYALTLLFGMLKRRKPIGVFGTDTLILILKDLIKFYFILCLLYYYVIYCQVFGVINNLPLY